MLKQERGITLVALVITIIVLLILAGVSISLVVGDNGLMSRASLAAKTQNIKDAEDAVGLCLSSMQAEFADDYAEGYQDDFWIWIQDGDGTDVVKDKLNNNISGYTIIDARFYWK